MSIFVVPAKGYFSVPFPGSVPLQHGAKWPLKLHYAVESLEPVKVCIFDSVGLENFEDDNEVLPFVGGGVISTFHDERVTLPYSSGAWHIVISNNGEKETTVCCMLYYTVWG